MNAKHERIVRTYTKITVVRLCTKATEQNCPDLTEPIATVAMSLLI